MFVKAPAFVDRFEVTALICVAVPIAVPDTPVTSSPLVEPSRATRTKTVELFGTVPVKVALVLLVPAVVWNALEPKLVAHTLPATQPRETVMLLSTLDVPSYT